MFIPKLDEVPVMRQTFELDMMTPWWLASSQKRSNLTDCRTSYFNCRFQMPIRYTSSVYDRKMKNIGTKKKDLATAAGFEPARAKPKRFLIFLLNHSDKLPINTK